MTCDCGAEKARTLHVNWCSTLKPASKKTWREFQEKAKLYSKPTYNMAYITDDLEKILDAGMWLPGIFVKQANFLIEDIDVFEMKFAEIWIEKDASNARTLFELALKTQDKSSVVRIF